MIIMNKIPDNVLWRIAGVYQNLTKSNTGKKQHI